MNRKEYMTANTAAYGAHPNDREAQKAATMAAHRAYYAQYVTPEAVRGVVSYVGAERILASTDEHMNDIPLRLWDSMADSRHGVLWAWVFGTLRANGTMAFDKQHVDPPRAIPVNRKERRTLAAQKSGRRTEIREHDDGIRLRTWEPAKVHRTVQISSRPWGGPAYIIVDEEDESSWEQAFKLNGVWREVLFIRYEPPPAKPSARLEAWKEGIDYGEMPTAGRVRINLPTALALALEAMARADCFEPIVAADLLRAWGIPALQSVYDLGGKQPLTKLVEEWICTAGWTRMRADRFKRWRDSVCLPEPPLPAHVKRKGARPLIAASESPWNFGGAVTGRTSSSRPNLQGFQRGVLPASMVTGPNVRAERITDFAEFERIFGKMGGGL